MPQFPTGVDKWDKELKSSEAFVHSRIWKGNNNFTLEKFIEGHKSAYTSMQQCSEHVPYKLPNARISVGYVLQNIQSNDAKLQTILAQVKHDDGPGGRREDFEKIQVWRIISSTSMRIIFEFHYCCG